MSKQEVIMLADGDIFAYNAASQSEYVSIFDEMYLLAGDMDAAKRAAKDGLDRIATEIKASEIIFVWSCPTRRYWRHDIFPEYKAKRSDIRTPICLRDLKIWLADQYPSVMRPNMEADDVLGILATNPSYKPNAKKVVVSIDKDMKTLPCWQYNPDADYQPWLQTLKEADKWHLAQAIGGDTTDGYGGCRGMSTDSALKFLEEPWYWEKYLHTFKSGPRKGKSEERWRKVEPQDMWSNICSLYHKAGMTEQDAICNAQMARITRFEDWNNNKVIPWTPRSMK